MKDASSEKLRALKIHARATADKYCDRSGRPLKPSPAPALDYEGPHAAVVNDVLNGLFKLPAPERRGAEDQFLAIADAIKKYRGGE